MHPHHCNYTYINLIEIMHTKGAKIIEVDTEIPLPAYTTTAYEGNLALQAIHKSCSSKGLQ
jgi:hypothetical protein